MESDLNNVIEEESFSLQLEDFDIDQKEDRLWQARTGLDFHSLCGAIETVIFMSDKPVSLKRIRNLIDPDMPLRVIHESISRLQNDYEEKHHGIRLQEVAEGFQFRTKSIYSKYVQDLFKVNSLVLTPSALEVMAIIAYRQPVSKSEIEKVRGVDSSHIVRTLMDKRLVKMLGRSEELGRPTMYGTTSEFLEVFNLKTLDDLPPEYEIQSLADSVDIDGISDISELVNNSATRFHFDEIEELDRLGQQIKDISADTTFTKSLRKEDRNKKEAEKLLSENLLKETSSEENPSEETPSEEISARKGKTAFEILEEYVLEKVIADQDREAAASEPVNPANIDPKIVKDLENGPFNTPEQDDDFQMIDLDEGTPILFEETSIAEEAKVLSKELDKAFTKLTGHNLPESHDSHDFSKDLEFPEEEVNQQNIDLEQKIEQSTKDAKDLDLDLEFLTDKD